MPKIKRTAQEVDAVKTSILGKALEMIAKDGFDSLSMRKLASKLGIAAKTIYNYFSNKEEIYIMVLTRGFEIMNAQAQSAGKNCDDPADKFAVLCREYVKFGIANKNYYSIMFNLDVPKYTDYVGTPIEPAAYHEKATAMKLAELGLQILDDLNRTHGTLAGADIPYLLLKIWSQLHGIVSLYNSRVMQEVSDTADQAVLRMTEDVIFPYMPIRNKDKKP